MKQYKIYTSPQSETEAVKQGWSWPACFYGFIWACVKGMWALGIGAFVAFIVLCLLAELASTDKTAADGAIDFTIVVFVVAFGATGNAWREKSLLSRGFKFAATVNASSPKRALVLHASSSQ